MGKQKGMSAIELSNVVKRWGETIAVNDVSFTIEDGQFVVLLGPSGCGKSTTLRMIAGLEEISAGKLAIDTVDMTTVAPSERHISMVFQSYALFPHLSVEENIVFGLKVRKVPTVERQKRLKKVSDLVGLSDLLDRKPAQLSGGQRQRVALARAFIAENKICLMDEPLSNLDAKLRQEMRVEIRALQERLEMTVIYVTHDQAEAMSMADKVILMRKGCVEQEGTPDALYNKPATVFSASFIGTPPMNLLNTTTDNHQVVVTGEGKTPVLELSQTKVVIGVRPEHISINNKTGIEAELVSADYQGADTVVNGFIGKQKILIRVPGRLSINKPVQTLLSWKKENVHVFELKNGCRTENENAFSV
jgi:sn-glycerol 3-phosphate transport system ATP-binding protein